MALDPYLQKQVELGMDGADIMHGHLKTLMLEAEKQLELAQEAEDESEEAMDSMERKYWEGVTETYAELYALTYEIAFAKGALNG
jgi:flagellar biosynthesis/type III secretory pathway protein FliH